MEKFMFRIVKFEVWSLLAILAFTMFLTFVFGYTAMRRAAPDSEFAGPMGALVEGIVMFPYNARRALVARDNHGASYETIVLSAGFNPTQKTAQPNYILISRYDADERASRIELVNETDFSVVHSQIIRDRRALAYPVVQPKIQRGVSDDPSSQRVVHPMLLDTGEIVFSLHYAPLYKIDTCGNVLWMNSEFAFHHAITKDDGGNFWVPGTSLDPLDTSKFDPFFNSRESFKDDYIVQLSADGDVLYSKSVLGILAENGLYNRTYSYDQYAYDPIHLNDIEPVLEDGPHWKRGDVFLSLAHVNMIMLFRPSTDELIWWSQDYMMHQHDVDILDDARIAYFDNRRRTHGAGDYTMGYNQIRVFDFETGTHEPIFFEQTEALKLKTVNQGLQDFGPDGSILMEETNTGRLIKLSADGELEWQYSNRSKADQAYTLNWSRYMTTAEAEAFLTGVEQTACGTK